MSKMGKRSLAVLAAGAMFLISFYMPLAQTESKAATKTKKPSIVKKVSIGVGQQKSIKITSKAKIKKTNWSLSKKSKSCVKLSKKNSKSVTVK